MKIEKRISPVVKNIRYLSGDEILLGVPGKANCRVTADVPADCTLSVNAVEKLKKGLSGILGVCPCAMDGAVEISLSLGEAPAGIVNPEQGYSIHAADGKVALVGFGAAGLYYAVTTLLQILQLEEGRLAIPAFDLLDYPDRKTRGHFMECRYGSNLMELEDWKAVVDHMESMKQNHLAVALYGCWCVQYDGKVSEYLYVPIKKYSKLQAPVYTKYYSPKRRAWINRKNLPPMVEKDFFGDLIAYGKTKGVEVIPMFNSFGHNTLIPAQYPEVSAKDENGEPTLTGFCTSNPKTYEMMFDIYDEIIDRYLKPNGITSFDVGLDEVNDGIAKNAEDIYRIRSPWCKCPACAGKSKIERFIEHAVKLIAHLKEKGMTNVYMYCDMLVNKRWGLDGASMGDCAKMMVEALKEKDLLDIVCFDWWSYAEVASGLMFDTTRPELGIRRSVKPWNGYYHWTVVTHTLNNTYLLTKLAHEENAEGVRSYSAWDKSYDRTHRLQADFEWNFEGAGSVEETKDRYVSLNFASRYDDAKRAYDLMDLAMQTVGHATPWGSSKELPCRSALMLRYLGYYFYSYVQAGKPYPRHFPGEAVSYLLENNGVESELRQIAALATDAAEIFDNLAKDTSVNMEIAARMRYENLNYKAICEDYMALLEMDRLAKSGCKCVYPKIRAMAKARKETRLTLMSLLENTKEHFLMASHMRNQSIFMQYFADLEAYLANTPADEVTLDFSDNSHFASAAFMNLR